MPDDDTVSLREHLDARIDDLAAGYHAYIADHRSIHDRSSAHVDRQVRELVEQSRREGEYRDQVTTIAMGKTEAATDQRFAAAAEHQAALAAQVARSLTRDEYITAHQVVVDRITDLASRVVALEATAIGRNEQRGSTGQLYGWAVAGISLVVSIGVLLVMVLTRG